MYLLLDEDVEVGTRGAVDSPEAGTSAFWTIGVSCKYFCFLTGGAVWKKLLNTDFFDVFITRAGGTGRNVEKVLAVFGFDFVINLKGLQRSNNLQ